jgi:hypothetical protein
MAIPPTGPKPDPELGHGEVDGLFLESHDPPQAARTPVFHLDTAHRIYVSAILYLLAIHQGQDA